MKYTLLFVLLMLLSCSDSTGPEEEAGYIILQPVNPEQHGGRLFGVTVSESSLGFSASFEEAQKAGIQVVELNLTWDQIEVSEGVYEDPWGVLGDISFYGSEDVQVLLTISPINTVKRSTPDYLDSFNFDSPEVIEAYNNMLVWVFAQISPDVTIAALSIGNEIDIFLDTTEEWNDYTGFYEEAVTNAKLSKANLLVGVKCTIMGGLFGSEDQEITLINQFSDIVMLNYYPQDENFHVLEPSIVHEHFSQVVQFFPNQTIWLPEVGYQSGSSYCNSSQTKQAHFYHELFAAWDVHKDKIGLIIIDWLHDATPEQVEEWEEYYGLSSPGFVEYLSTLGLRNYDHSDKFAWTQILVETAARGWE